MFEIRRPRISPFCLGCGRHNSCLFAAPPPSVQHPLLALVPQAMREGPELYEQGRPSLTKRRLVQIHLHNGKRRPPDAPLVEIQVPHAHGRKSASYACSGRGARRAMAKGRNRDGQTRHNMHWRSRITNWPRARRLQGRAWRRDWTLVARAMPSIDKVSMVAYMFRPTTQLHHNKGRKPVQRERNATRAQRDATHTLCFCVARSELWALLEKDAFETLGRPTRPTTPRTSPA